MAKQRTFTDDNGAVYNDFQGGIGKAGVGWYACDICGQHFERSKFMKFRELFYGVPCGCYKDIEDIKLKENPRTPRSERPLRD